VVNNIIAGDSDVVGVRAKADKFAFGPLESADDLRLDYDVTLSPPKKYFQPPVETLMTYKVGGEYKSEISDRKLVLIGVHPYDMIAINQMDELFSQDEYDTHYMARRSNTTVIACDVVTASKNVFASSMKTATVKTGYDILLTDIGDAYIADAPTEKGQALLKTAAADAIDATDDDLAKRKAVQDNNEESLNRHKLNCDVSQLPELLDGAYEHPVWEEKAATCYACGSCNLTCPTCYCFDVQDDVEWSLESGQRSREWDGCLLKDFATVAGDHNFRQKRQNRFRHRLYRKAKYVPAKIGGQIACVGCGRCVGACIPDIANPVAIYNRLLEDK
jgi:formate hydrogenlyase subunit 6/NADH:ubiquinone oxidoreductase subunit I